MFLHDIDMISNFTKLKLVSDLFDLFDKPLFILTLTEKSNVNHPEK